jgi:hypothetical protein
MIDSLTPFEGGILKLIARCGGARVDLSGQRINDRAKAAALTCRRKGYLNGEPWSWNLTEAGRAALEQQTP